MDGGWNAPADDPDDQPQVVGPTPLAPTTSWSPSAAECQGTGESGRRRSGDLDAGGRRNWTLAARRVAKTRGIRTQPRPGNPRRQQALPAVGNPPTSRGRGSCREFSRFALRAMVHQRDEPPRNPRRFAVLAAGVPRNPSTLDGEPGRVAPALPRRVAPFRIRRQRPSTGRGSTRPSHRPHTGCSRQRGRYPLRRSGTSPPAHGG
jgi:hypothetical protein